MGWKNWQSWIKGGIIGLLIYLLLLIFNEFLFINTNSNFLISLNEIILFPLDLIEFISSIITESLFSLPDKVNYLTVTIIAFGIGAIIGWIIGKIKKK